MRIGLDFDGTIVDHTETKIRLAKKFGIVLSNAQTVSESIKNHVPEGIYRKIQKEIYGEETMNSRPMEGVEKIIPMISRLSSGLYIVSRRGRGVEGEIDVARCWIKKFLSPFFASSQIYFVKEDKEKDIVCKELGVSLFLDDKIAVLDNLASVTHKVFFDQFGIFEGKDFSYERVRNWQEFYEFFKEISLHKM